MLSQTPPSPSDPAEIARVKHTRKRRRLLYSCHEPDLLELMERQLGNVRRAAWGAPDMTANPFLSLWEQSARLYALEPQVDHEDSAGRDLLDRVAEAGLWSLMQRVQRDTLALREMALRITTEDGALVFRPVFPDMAEAVASPRRPSLPLVFSEWVQDDGLGWVKLTADTRNATWRAVTQDGDNVTQDVLGTSEWQYTGSTGPALPYSLIHAQECGWTWDPYTLSEIVDGSLNIGLYLTYYGHLVRNAAWAQRYAAGVRVDAAGVRDAPDAARLEVITDPATLLLLSAEEGQQPMVGQWSPAGDPEAILRSVAMYERRILTLAGLHPPDVTRQSADIRSGYSLVVARESIREQQRLFAPSFRRGDLETLRIAAIALNTAEGTSYPEAGYSIRYQGLPPSPVEDRAKREHVTELLDRGVVTPEEARHALSDVLSRLEIAA